MALRLDAPGKIDQILNGRKSCARPMRDANREDANREDANRYRHIGA
ncbi:MAG: hypothetical protein ACKODB_10395 [Betaproteobacteria bacterium]